MCVLFCAYALVIHRSYSTVPFDFCDDRQASRRTRIPPVAEMELFLPFASLSKQAPGPGLPEGSKTAKKRGRGDFVVRFFASFPFQIGVRAY